MTQKQRPPENNATNSSSQNLRGNYAAKLQADKIEIPEIPFSPDDYLNECRLVADVCNEYGGQSLDGHLGSDEGTHNFRARMKELIKVKKIDPKTMGWVKTLQGHDNKVCVCLDFNCRIGPFIPVRKSVDK